VLRTGGAFRRICWAGRILDWNLGAITVFLLTFTEREKILTTSAKSLTGARFTTSYTRIGGVSRDTRRAGAMPSASSSAKLSSTSRRWRRCSRATKSGWTRTRDVGVISKADAIDYGLSGPNMRGSGVDTISARRSLIFATRIFHLTCARLGRRLLRPLPRAHGGNAARACAFCISAWTKSPAASDNQAKEPVNVTDGKIVLPAKDKVMSGMEELIHQFMLVTQRHECAARRNLFRP